MKLPVWVAVSNKMKASRARRLKEPVVVGRPGQRARDKPQPDNQERQ